MPMQPTDNNTDKMKRKPSDAPARIKPAQEDGKEDPQANYGFGQRATVDPDGQVTERQEYSEDGLPRTERYGVDKDRHHKFDDLPDDVYPRH